jgi:hypothetical protein
MADNDEVVVDNVENEGGQSAPDESEVKARRLGWVPQEEFKGDPEQWRDANQFLKRGEEIHGFLKADLDKLHQTLSQKDKEIAEIRSVMEDFRKFHNETEARAYKRAIEELKQLKVGAIEQGDGAKVVEIDEQIDQLKEAQRKPVDPVKQADQVNQEYLDWLPQNRWYVEDRELQELAEEAGEAIKAKSPTLVGKQFLEEVTKRVKRMAPDKFENPARSQSTVGSSSDGRQPTGKKKNGYNDLPPDVKAQCDKLTKQMFKNNVTGKLEPLLTVEQYCKDYFGS